MSKKSKKKKRDSKPRPIFICPKCKAYWVHDYYHTCTVCGTVGEPQNESAARFLRWRENNAGNDETGNA